MATSTDDSITPEQLAHWRTWLGRTEQRGDVVTAAPLNAWAAALDRDDPDALPGTDVLPLAHWLFFLPVVIAEGALAMQARAELA